MKLLCRVREREREREGEREREREREGEREGGRVMQGRWLYLKFLSGQV